MIQARVILLLFLSAFLSLANALHAQRHDNRWIFGWGTCLVPPSGVRDIVFDDYSPQLLNTCRGDYVGFGYTNTNLSDARGNLLCFTNGGDLFNRIGQVMPNGGNLIDSVLGLPYVIWGGGIEQGALLLPFAPSDTTTVQLVRLDLGDSATQVNSLGEAHFLKLTTLDMGLYNGLGDVVLRDTNIVVDSLAGYSMQACRHANGRDWWVLAFEYTGTGYYSVLVSPWGAVSVEKHHQDHYFVGGHYLGQSCFSPNGEWFACNDARDGLNLWRFDRCTGRLGQHARLYTPPFNPLLPLHRGVAFSSNGRYAYFNMSPDASDVEMWQLKVASLPQLDTVWIATGSDFLNPPVLPYWVFYSEFKLGPDGKIYVRNGGTDTLLHVLHRPNRNRANCALEPVALILPNYINYSFPVHPHFLLGPLDGSACDTLGLDQALALHGPRLDFGPVPLGGAATLSFWLRNPGEGVLVVDTLRFDSAQFSCPIALPFSVPSGDSLYLPVTFVPTAHGFVDAELTLHHNGIAGLSTVWVTGSGDTTLTSNLPAAPQYSALRLWPNPTAGNVQLSFSAAHAGETLLTVHDALGRAVLALPVQVVAGINRFVLPLEGLLGGVYSVMLRGVGAGRVVKN